MCTGMDTRTSTSGCGSIILCWLAPRAHRLQETVLMKVEWISLRVGSGIIEGACASAIVAHKGFRGGCDGCWINRLNSQAAVG